MSCNKINTCFRYGTDYQDRLISFPNGIAGLSNFRYEITQRETVINLTVGNGLEIIGEKVCIQGDALESLLPDAYDTVFWIDINGQTRDLFSEDLEISADKCDCQNLYNLAFTIIPVDISENVVNIYLSWEDLTPAQILELQQPAIDAGNEVRQQVDDYIDAKELQINPVILAAETATQEANDAAQTANTAAQNADEKATAAQTAADNANEATTAAETATQEANNATSAANTATGNANNATTAANTAAGNAQSAADEANSQRSWTSIYSFEPDGLDRELKKLVDYFGGTGDKPTENIGKYVSESGYTSVKANATNFKGNKGDNPYLGIITPSTTIPATGSWYGTILAEGTFNNVTPAITVDAADFDIENGTANNEVRIIISDGVATKDVRRVKGEVAPSTSDKWLYGEMVEVTPVYENGGVSATGANVASSLMQRSDFIPVSFGDQFDISASDTASRLVISAYSSATPESFIAGAPENTFGGSLSGQTIYRTIKISTGVNFIRVVHVKTNPDSLKYIRKINKRLEGSSNTGILSTYDEKILKFNAHKKRVVSRRMPTFSIMWDGGRNNNHEIFDIFREFGLFPSYATQVSDYATRINIYRDLERKGAGIVLHNGGTGGTQSTMHGLAFVATEKLGFKISGMVQQSSNLATQYWPQVKKYYGYAFVKSAPLKGVFDSSLFNHTIDPCEMTRVGLEEWNKDEINQAAIKAMIDFAITNNLLVNFYGHNLPSSHKNTDGTSVFTAADLRGVLTYIKEKQDAGLCKFRITDDAVREYYML